MLMQNYSFTENITEKTTFDCSFVSLRPIYTILLFVILVKMIAAICHMTVVAMKPILAGNYYHSYQNRYID